MGPALDLHQEAHTLWSGAAATGRHGQWNATELVEEPTQARTATLLLPNKAQTALLGPLMAQLPCVL